MQLKKVADKSGGGDRPWPLDRVIALTAPARQKFSSRFVEGALLEGWLSMTGMNAGDTITLRVQPEELTYRIVAVPGRYCSHCDEKLPDDAAGEQARVHVALYHPDVPSPDPENPSGYRCDNFYACERVS